MAVAVAVLASSARHPGNESVLFLLVAAIALVTRFLGLGPGILASIGAASAASYYLLSHSASAAAGVSHLLCWGTFILISLLIGLGVRATDEDQGGRLDHLLRNRARSAVAEHQALLEAVLRQMPEGVLIAEAASGRIVLRNEQGSRILRGVGEAPAGVEDFVRRVPLRRSTGRPYEPDQWPLARALWRGEIVTGEEVEISASEGPRTLRVSAAPVLSHDGSLAAGVATFSDITEHKRSAAAQRLLVAAGTALTSSLDHQKTLSAVARLTIPALADWCLVELAEDDGRIRHVAEAHVVREQERALREIALKCAEKPGGMPLVRSVLDTGKTAYYPEIQLGAGAEPIGFSDFRAVGAVSGMTVPLRARGRTLGTIGFFYSVSGRRYSMQDMELAEDLARRAALALDNARLYREAQEANRIKDEFLATVSHELRTPLHAMLGWTRLLRTRRLDAGMSAHALEVIERNATAQHKLINDILDLSSLIRGKIRLAMRPIDLAPVVERAIETAIPAAQARSIRIDFFAEPETGTVSGDPDRLQQVFWNLLSNAIKFTPEGGTVQVQLTSKGRTAEIEFADNGTGIRADVLPHIFERFRQGDGTTARPHGGLGMGLAIVRHTVELHGGAVQADSAGEGRGARFVVTLPLRGSRRADAVSGRPQPSTDRDSVEAVK